MPRFFTLLCIFIAIVLCSGCFITTALAPSASKLNRVEIGMSKSAVIDRMGQPDSVSAKGNTEYLQYRLAYEKDYSGCWYFGMLTWAHKADYFVRLVDGKVDAYGRRGDFDSTKDPSTKIELDAKIKKE